VARKQARKRPGSEKQSPGTIEADLILHSGRIYKVDARRGWAEALAVKDGKIIAVGTNKVVQRFRGNNTKLAELDGRMAMPGLVDVHNHHTRGGQLDLFEVSFPASLSFDQILERVRERAGKMAPGEWLSGGIWSSELVSRLGQLSAKAELDAASQGRAVMLRDDSLHNRWVNSKALELIGITNQTPNPADGEIVRDSGTGEAVGLLVEKASTLAEKVVFRSIKDPAGRDIASTRRAVEILNSYGVTAYQDANTTLPMLKALKALDKKGQLNAWCVASLPVFDTLTGTEVYGEALIARREQYRTAHVRPDFIKLFMDGVPMTRTAAMLEPYKPDQRGNAVVCRSFIPVPEVVRWITRAEELGLAVKIHCAGDAAVRDILDAIEIVRDFRGPGPAHHIAMPAISIRRIFPASSSLMSWLTFVPRSGFHAPSRLQTTKCCRKDVPTAIGRTGIFMRLERCWPRGPTGRWSDCPIPGLASRAWSHAATQRERILARCGRSRHWMWRP